jgi:hypothetical protein
MHIHKPKLWQGGREFLKEYLIIVVGVLTALALEQAVEWLHTRAQVAETREALRAEISGDATEALIVRAEDQCALILDDKFNAWAKGGPKPTFSPVPVYPILQSSAWETSKSGVISHMALKERLAWAQVYNSLDGINANEVAQKQAAFEIAPFIYQEKLQGSQTERLIEGVSKVATVDRYQIAAAPEFVRLARALGANPAPITAERRRMLDQFCREIGAPPPSF